MTHKPTSAACPRTVLDWIAWYPDGDLAPEVRSEIEVHAAECAACRAEIAALTTELADDSAADDAPAADDVFARVLQKVEAHPRRLAPPRTRRMWMVRPPIAVAASLLVAAISGTVGVIAMRQLDPAFEQATASASAHASGAHLQVVFREDVSFAEVSHALHVLGASVESGPSENGVVNLHLARGADAAAAAARLESGDLRVAQFAQLAP
jgi:anti-sigma factor RsiW